MPKASVKRLIECNKEQLVDLVLDIENYPKFIPYCLEAKIYEKKEEKNLILIIADLTIGKGPFKATYKSDVKFNKDTDTIHVTNIEGPLKYLDNKWAFFEKSQLFYPNHTEKIYSLQYLKIYFQSQNRYQKISQ